LCGETETYTAKDSTLEIERSSYSLDFSPVVCSLTRGDWKLSFAWVALATPTRFESICALLRKFLYPTGTSNPAGLLRLADSARHCGTLQLDLSGPLFIYLANVTTLFGMVEDYGPLWSLAVEEHYYLVWPLVVRYLSRRQVGIVAALISAVTAMIRALASHGEHVSGLGSFTWFVADGLAFGSVLAVLVRGALSRSQLWALSGRTIVLGTMAVLLGGPFGIMTGDRLLGAAFQYIVIHVIFTGIFLLFLLIGTSRWSALVNIGWLQFFGFISYGLYLIHLLPFRLYDRLCRTYAPSFLLTSGRSDLLLLRFAVAGGTAVAVAHLSRVYFEDYFLRLKQKLSR
jgi:peptidoglycan/LPS O-acetylase OafA/YrhL